MLSAPLKSTNRIMYVDGNRAPGNGVSHKYPPTHKCTGTVIRPQGVLAWRMRFLNRGGGTGICIGVLSLMTWRGMD